MSETKDEEPSVIDNSIINAPRYVKLFECGVVPALDRKIYLVAIKFTH